jgi:adenylosuccinate synthase
LKIVTNSVWVRKSQKEEQKLEQVMTWKEIKKKEIEEMCPVCKVADTQKSTGCGPARQDKQKRRNKKRKRLQKKWKAESAHLRKG